MASNVPILIRVPIRSMLPSSRSAIPIATAVPPYRKPISARSKPPSRSTLANITTIARKSSPVMKKFATVRIAKDVR
jgi:hypothetical protein